MYSTDETNRRLSLLEKRIKQVYRQAERELNEKSRKYLEDLEKRYKKEYEAYLGGIYTPEEFEHWYQAQIGRSQRWIDLRDQMAQRITDANLAASAYIRDDAVGIYALNYNYEAYRVENAYSSNVFEIYDAETVKRLLADDPQLLPQPRINIPKDLQWNRTKLQNELTSGIIQGKSMRDIAKGFEHVAGMNRTNAIRNARTSYTGAQNGGRYDSLNKAVDMGIKVEKEWLCTHDNRTRDSHRYLDGEHVPMQKKFSNGLMYPADPSGRPEEVYNCRCTMVGYFPDSPKQMDRTTYYEAQGYKQWIAEKSKEQELFIRNTIDGQRVYAIKTTLQKLQGKTGVKFLKGLENAEPRTRRILEKNYANVSYYNVTGIINYYDPNRNAIFISKEAAPSSVAHEIFHSIDRNNISGILRTPLNNDYLALEQMSSYNILNYLTTKYPEAFESASLNENIVVKEEYRGISDILYGMSNGSVFLGYAHKREYYKEGDNMVMEAWSQMGRTYYDNNKNAVKMFEELFPSMTKTGFEMMEAL